MPDATALRHKELGLWQDVTWEDYYRKAEAVGLGLIALGLQPKQSFAVLAESRPEWVYAELGGLCAGAIVAGIYPTSAPDQVRYVVEHSDARFLFVEDEEQLDKWLEVRDALPLLEKVIFMDGTGLHDLKDPMIMSFSDLCKLGEEHLSQHPQLFQERGKAVAPEDIAMLIYTSGTTGPPKGAMLTHKGVTWTPGATFELNPVTPKDRILSFLPLCHIFEQLFTVLGHMLCGYQVHFAESMEAVPENLREVMPTVGYGVPRIWEKFQSQMLLRMEDATWFKRKAFAWSIKRGETYRDARLVGKPSPLLSVLYYLAHWFSLRKLLKRFGLNKMKIAYSGAAPISPSVLAFYQAIGLNLLEGYGQTESGGVSTINSGTDNRPRSVGRALPGTEIRLADDGEILVKCPGNFVGYYKDEAATEATLEDGWLHSGDVGAFDADGFLSIVDRKKDLIITAGGKNIAPQNIENKLKFSPYINDAIVIGDGRKYLTALIVLDEEGINRFTRKEKISYATYADLSNHEAIQTLIEGEVKNVNSDSARVQHVRKFRILPKRLYHEDGEVTPTMKVKRNAVHKAWGHLIEDMYR